MVLITFPFGSVTGNEKEKNLTLAVNNYTIGTDTLEAILSVEKSGKTDSLFSGKYLVKISQNEDTINRELTFREGRAQFKRFIDQNTDLTVHLPAKKLEATQSIIYRPSWTSIVPPLLAIILALIFREVITSLFLGILSGLLLIKGFTPGGLINSLFRFVDHYLLEVLSSTSHLSIIIFSLLIGGTVSLISANRGMAGLIEHLKRWAKSVRRTQFVTWLIGLLIFFDDYANTLIVGNTMRPLTDKFRISREKLAYLVDSTAAPIASVAFITTWIGAQLDYISGATADLPIDQNAYSIFFNSLSYAFYPVFSIVFILFIILSKRDFGPMYKAEQNARNGFIHPDHENSQENETQDPKPGKAVDALIPLLTLIFTAFGALLYTGFDKAIWQNEPIGLIVKLAKTIGKANAYVALLWASLTSLIVAFLFTIFRKTSVEKAVSHITEGFKSMLGALMILILAWTLAMITNSLSTAEFLAELFTGNVNPYLIPGLIFLLAALVSFSTGSSWGTMAILYPLVLPMTYQAGIGSDLSHEAVLPVFYHVVSVVLAGSVLGDHCSPLSDTTILSSLSTKCYHIHHVRTQLPYALLVGSVSLVVGHLLTGFNWLPVWLAFILGLIILWVLVRYILGKRVTD